MLMMMFVVMTAAAATVLTPTVSLVVMFPVFEHVLHFAAEEYAGESAQDPMICLLTQKVTADTAGYRSEKATLAFFGVVWVFRVASVPVWIGGIAGRRWTSSPWCLLSLVLSDLLTTVLRCWSAIERRCTQSTRETHYSPPGC